MKGGEAASATYEHQRLGPARVAGEVTAERTLPSEDTLSTGYIDWLRKSH